MTTLVVVLVGIVGGLAGAIQSGALGAGIMGLVVVASLGITVSRLGLGAGLTLFTASTLLLGALIDHFGWTNTARPLDIRGLAGFALVILGTWLVVGRAG